MAKHAYRYSGTIKTSDGTATVRGTSKRTRETLVEFTARFSKENPHIELTDVHPDLWDS